MRVKSVLKSSFVILGFISSADAIAQTASHDTISIVEGEADSTLEPTQRDHLEEIVVTAQKRRENLQAVPIAITSISESRLSAAGVITVQDLNAAVPGLTLLNVGGNITPRIRGVGSTSTSAGLEAPVAVYVDGVYYAFSADLQGELADVSQISVLKGPQGTLFGRNATGGVVQITTKNPTRDPQLEVSTSIDNYATWRSNLFVGGPVANNLRASFAAQYTTQGNGWGTNIFNGQDVHKIDNAISLRGKIIYEPSSATTITVGGDYGYRSGSYATEFRNFPNFPFAFTTAQTSRKWDINTYIQPENKYRGGGASMTAEQNLGRVVLTSISAYREGSNFFKFTPAGSTPSIDLDISDYSRQFSEELQLVSSGASAFKWAVGGFYFHNYANQNPQDINFYGPLASAFSKIRILADQKLDSIAGFAQGTLSVTDTTRVTAGARYTYEKKTLNGAEFGYPIGAPATFSVQLGPDVTSSLSFKKLTWRFAVDQDIAKDILFYASYNRGFKSGGFNIRDPLNPPFQPEQLDAFEVGVKSELLDNRVRLNVGGFLYKYKNVQVSRYETTTIIFNGAKAETYGLDVDLEAKLADRLNLNAGASYLHTRFTDFKNAPASVFAPNGFGGTTITIVTVDATGNKLPYSPEFTYTVGLNYTIPTAVGDYRIDASDSYTSSFFSEPDNRLRETSHHIVNAALSWRSKGERYGVRLFMNNILNQAVANQFGTLDVGYIADYPSPPRIFGLQLSVKY